jgi:hypothetical protein
MRGGEYNFPPRLGRGGIPDFRGDVRAVEPLIAASIVWVALENLLLAGIRPAVVEFCHGAGLAHEAVARRVILYGVAVGCVRTTRVTLIVRTAGIVTRSRERQLKHRDCIPASRCLTQINAAGMRSES